MTKSHNPEWIDAPDTYYNKHGSTKAICHHFGGFAEKHAPVSIPQIKPTRYPPASQLWLSAMRSNMTHGRRNNKPRAPLTTLEIGIFNLISSNITRRVPQVPRLWAPGRPRTSTVLFPVTKIFRHLVASSHPLQRILEKSTRLSCAHRGPHG